VQLTFHEERQSIYVEPDSDYFKDPAPIFCSWSFRTDRQWVQPRVVFALPWIYVKACWRTQVRSPFHDRVSYGTLGGHGDRQLRLMLAEFGFSTPEHPSHGFEVAVPVDRVRK
jgi:hypothetical protein